MWHVSTKEIKDAIRIAVSQARKHGYRVDDELYSDAGFAVVEALRTWKKKEDGRNLAGYTTLIFLQMLMRRKMEYNLLEDAAYVPDSRQLKSDYCQYLLCQEPEPWQSICFSVWIDYKPLTEVSKTYDIKVHRIQSRLLEIAEKLRFRMDDSYNNTRHHSDTRRHL